MVNGKYTQAVRAAIDSFWKQNHYPPTIRDLMAICHIPSTSHTWTIVRSFSDIRITKHGHAIPRWVDELLLVQNVP